MYLPDTAHGKKFRTPCLDSPPPHAFVHQGSRGPPKSTADYASSRFMRSRTKRALACACLMPSSMNEWPSGVYEEATAGSAGSRGYVAMAGKAEQQGGLWMEPLCESWEKKLHRRRLQWACPDIQTARDWPRQHMSSPAISPWLLFDGDCGGGTPSTFHNTLARICPVSIAREKLVGADRSPEAW